MKVQFVCEGGETAATTIMARTMIRYSKHQIEINSIVDEHNKPDIVVFICTAWIDEVYPLMLKHPDIHFFMTLTDYANFRKGIGYHKSNNDKFKRLSGLIACGEEFENICKKYTEDIPIFTYESSTDTELFVRAPKPKNFSIGIAEKIPEPQRRYFYRFLTYPYPKYSSCDGLGTGRLYIEMPNFYNHISVFTDPTTDSRPGGIMFLEAGAVGRPSIALKEGILAKWFPDRWLAKDDQGMIDLLHQLHDDEDLYQKASDEWYNIAQSRNYGVSAKEFDVAFDSVSK